MTSDDDIPVDDGNPHVPPIGAQILKLEDYRNGWHADLLYTDKMRPRANLANAITALRRAPEWLGVLAYDEFAHKIVARRPPPWLHTSGGWQDRAWTETDTILGTDWLQHQDIAVQVEVVWQAALAVAKEHGFHPVRDYLNAQHWDGEPRIDLFARDILGAPDTAYARAVTRATFIAAVARPMDPGCKVDTVLSLEGLQGNLKSTGIDILFRPWFADTLSPIGTKDANQELAGVWCIELSELAALKNQKIETTKSFITRRMDRYRPAYGRVVADFPRQCIFIATTNAETYLRDETGGRRFWPVRCGRLNIDLLTATRDQLWAEALAIYLSGEPWWLTDTALVEAAEEEQADRFDLDPWEAKIREHLKVQSETSVEELLTSPLGVDCCRQTKADAPRVGRILRHMGWRRKRVGPRHNRSWIYVQPERSQNPEEGMS
jgi:predicted P-loop ATPase